MNCSKGLGFALASALVPCLIRSAAAQSTVLPVSENFEDAVLGTTVSIDSSPGTDLRGTVGAKPLTGTVFQLMQTGGASPGFGLSTATIVDDSTATHAVTTSNRSQYVQVDLFNGTGGSIASILYTAFSGHTDGEGYIMKVDIFNPNDATPRLAASMDISPNLSNFGWHNNNSTHSRMYDTDPNADWQSWWMVVNDTAGSIDYLDPDGVMATIEAQTAVRWIDGVKDDGGGSFNLANPADLMGISSGASNTGGPGLTFYADNFSIVGIPAPLPFDYGNDGDVDADDGLIFMECISGPTIPLLPAACTAEQFAISDADHDGDVDLADFGIFQRCFSGRDIAASRDCAD